MSQLFPTTAKALRAALLCALLVPLAAACGANSTTSNTTAAGAAGTAHASSSAASTAPAASSSAAPSTATGGSATCPSAAAVSAAAGTTYPKPQVESAAGDTSCDYNDPDSGANLVIEIAPANGITPAGLQVAMTAEAKGSTGKATPVSGIGSAAYIFTENDASTNSNGDPTALVGAVSSTLYVVVVAPLPPADLEAVTRLALSE
jgi:hypothetical protein